MDNILLIILLPVVGIVLGWTIRWLYARFQLSASEQRAERIKQDAIKEAEAQKKEILLEAKEQLIREQNSKNGRTVSAEATCKRWNDGLSKKKKLWIKETAI